MTTMLDGRAQVPWALLRAEKYRLPFQLPSWTPRGSSSSTPTHTPSAKPSTGPTYLQSTQSLKVLLESQMVANADLIKPSQDPGSTMHSSDDDAAA